MKQDELLRPLSPNERDALEGAVSTFQGHLTEEAEAYLDGRGIGPMERMKYRLGMVGGEVPPGYERYRGMIAIPYLDRHGSPLSIRYRCSKDHDHKELGHPKYMGPPGEATRMFNIRAIFEAEDEIHIAEGEGDAIVLTASGLPAVAIPGVSNWKSHHRRMLAGFSRIYVWGDPDEAGAEFNKTICRQMRQGKAVPIRGGDATDLWKAKGADALRALVKEA